MADSEGRFPFVTPAGSKPWRRKHRFQGKENTCRLQARAVTSCRRAFIRPFGPIPCAIANAWRFLRKTTSNPFTDATLAIRQLGSFSLPDGTMTDCRRVGSTCPSSIQRMIGNRSKSPRSAVHRFVPGVDGVAHPRGLRRPAPCAGGMCPTSRLSLWQSRLDIDVRRSSDTRQSGHPRNGSWTPWADARSRTSSASGRIRGGKGEFGL